MNGGKHGRNQGRHANIPHRARVKEALRTAAEREHRSNANMVEVMILEYCRMKGIAIPEEGHG